MGPDRRSWIDDRNIKQQDATVYRGKRVVERVQEELNERGYSAGMTDGILGKNTSAALTRFQRHEGIETTGIIDGKTLKALRLESFATESSNEFAE